MNVKWNFPSEILIHAAVLDKSDNAASEKGTDCINDEIKCLSHGAQVAI